MYLDTSVFGGCFDEGFEAPSRAVIEYLAQGNGIVVISDFLQDELSRMPDNIRTLLTGIPARFQERVRAQDDSIELRDAYIAAGMQGERFGNEIHHAAIASLAKVDGLITWRFREVFKLEGSRRINEVNLAHGLPHLEIQTPYAVGDWGERHTCYGTALKNEVQRKLREESPE